MRKQAPPQEGDVTMGIITADTLSGAGTMTPRPDLFTRNQEPLLADLLADPIVAILMASDGVAPQRLTDYLDAARRRMAA